MCKACGPQEKKPGRKGRAEVYSKPAGDRRSGNLRHGGGLPMSDESDIWSPVLAGTRSRRGRTADIVLRAQLQEIQRGFPRGFRHNDDQDQSSMPQGK